MPGENGPDDQNRYAALSPTPEELAAIARAQAEQAAAAAAALVQKAAAAYAAVPDQPQQPAIPQPTTQQAATPAAPASATPTASTEKTITPSADNLKVEKGAISFENKWSYNGPKDKEPNEAQKKDIDARFNAVYDELKAEFVKENPDCKISADGKLVRAGGGDLTEQDLSTFAEFYNRRAPVVAAGVFVDSDFDVTMPKLDAAQFAKVQAAPAAVQAATAAYVALPVNQQGLGQGIAQGIAQGYTTNAAAYTELEVLPQAELGTNYAQTPGAALPNNYAPAAQAQPAPATNYVNMQQAAAPSNLPPPVQLTQAELDAAAALPPRSGVSPLPPPIAPDARPNDGRYLNMPAPAAYQDLTLGAAEAQNYGGIPQRLADGYEKPTDPFPSTPPLNYQALASEPDNYVPLNVQTQPAPAAPGDGYVAIPAQAPAPAAPAPGADLPPPPAPIALDARLNDGRYANMPAPAIQQYVGLAPEAPAANAGYTPLPANDSTAGAAPAAPAADASPLMEAMKAANIEKIVMKQPNGGPDIEFPRDAASMDPAMQEQITKAVKLSTDIAALGNQTPPLTEDQLKEKTQELVNNSGFDKVSIGPPDGPFQSYSKGGTGPVIETKADIERALGQSLQAAAPAPAAAVAPPPQGGPASVVPDTSKAAIPAPIAPDAPGVGYQALPVKAAEVGVMAAATAAVAAVAPAAPTPAAPTPQPTPSADAGFFAEKDENVKDDLVQKVDSVTYETLLRDDQKAYSHMPSPDKVDPTPQAARPDVNAEDAKAQGYADILQGKEGLEDDAKTVYDEAPNLDEVADSMEDSKAMPKEGYEAIAAEAEEIESDFEKGDVKTMATKTSDLAEIANETDRAKKMERGAEEVAEAGLGMR